MAVEQVFSSSRFLQCVPVVTNDHGRHLLEALYEQQQSGELCDIWLVIGEERFAAHKAVLASFSSYFHAFFESGQDTGAAGRKACGVREIVLSSVEKSTFLPILHFIYTSRLHVFKENVVDILRTAKKLQIASIVQVCGKLIKNKVVLPSLKDVDSSVRSLEIDTNEEATNDVFYMDLSDCGEGEGQATTMSSSLPYKSSRRNVETFQANSGIPISADSALGKGLISSPSLHAPPLVEMTRPTRISNREIQPIEPKDLMCPHCGEVFHKNVNLQQHVLTNHLPWHNYSLSCPKCGKTCANEQSLLHHMSASKCGDNPPRLSLSDELSSLSAIRPQLDADSIDLTAADSQIPHTPTDESTGRNRISFPTSNSKVSPGRTLLRQTSAGDHAFFALPSSSSCPSAVDGPRTSAPQPDALKLSPDSYSRSVTMLRESEFGSDDDLLSISGVNSKKETSFVSSDPNDLEPQSTVAEHSSNTSTRLALVSSLDSMPMSVRQNSPLARGTSTLACVTREPNLVKIDPKVSLMASMKKHSEPRLQLHDQRLAQGIGTPTFAGLCNISEGHASEMLLNRQSIFSLRHLIPTTGVTSETTGAIDANCELLCSVCAATFPTYDELRVHKRRCCKCPHCNRIFTHYSNMKRHVVIFHTKQKPHKCGVCGKAYGIKQSLRSHVETKHGIPYVSNKYGTSKGPGDFNV